MSDRDTPIHADAHALRPVRIVGNELRVYEGTTFPRGPRDGCDLWRRRLAATGGIARDEATTYATLDVLTEDGDIVQDYPLTRGGFKYLKRKLGFRVETDDDDE